MTEERPEELYIVFDGPPGHVAGRFVEVENECGESVDVGSWRQSEEDGYWRLGPFQKVNEGLHAKLVALLDESENWTQHDGLHDKLAGDILDLVFGDEE